MSSTLSRTAAATVALLVPLALAACSGGEPAGPTTAPSASITAEDVADDETSATEETAPAETPAGPDASEEFFSRMKAGTASITTARTVMDMALDGTVMMRTEGVIDYTAPLLAMRITMTSPDGVTDMTSVDGVVYVNDDLAGGGPWVRLPEGAAGSLAEESDPMAKFDAFEAFTVGVVKIGTEDVDGVGADHFVVTADTSLMPDDSLVSFGPTLDYHIWLDADGRPLRMEFTLEAQGSSMVATTTMSDLDVPVTIEAPPADQVVDLNDLQTDG